MAFRAVHARWGQVLAHLPDLGCGRDWREVWRVRPRAPLRCDECSHPMYAKVSRNGMRFFAHAPGAPKCALAQESAEHHLLKLELAAAARDAGAHAELEVRGPDGAWRADVLASDPAGAWRVALEAQLSPITADDISARTARMLKDGVSSVWFSDRVRVPWFGVVPWARVRAAERGGLLVIEGLSWFANGHWEQGPPAVPAAEFLRWVFGDRVVAHQRRAAVRSPLAARHILWTPPRYAELEVAHLAELEAKERRKQEELQLRQEKDRIALEARRARQSQELLEKARQDEARAAQGDREAAVRALKARQDALRVPSARFVHQATGVYPFVPDHGSPQFAMGLPVYVGSSVYGVICPVASRVQAARKRLAGLVVFAASQHERQRISAQADPGQRIEVLDGHTAAVPSQRQPPGQGTLPLHTEQTAGG
ncbi:competence protein CoiA family protein [Streptomyces sp. NPDC001930]|uniref:competence protein CoiA family protein n=1 Tax=Streptomyces sp. NPDC001930 TaxID=3364625 RepID=UPI0036AE230D